MPGQVHHRLGLKGPAQFLVETALRGVRPAQERRPGALQADDLACGEDGPLAVRQAGRRPEQAGGGVDWAVVWKIAQEEPPVLEEQALAIIRAEFPDLAQAYGPAATLETEPGLRGDTPDP